MAESYYVLDHSKNRIAVWHRHAWLYNLKQSGITQHLFIARSKTKGRSKNKIKRCYYDETHIRTAQAYVERCLSSFNGYVYWLRDFVLQQ